MSNSAIARGPRVVVSMRLKAWCKGCSGPRVGLWVSMDLRGGKLIHAHILDESVWWVVPVCPCDSPEAAVSCWQVSQGFFWGFFPMSRSYKVTKVTMVFRNVQFFLLKQGFRSYAVSKVTVLFTRFQKLQGSKCCNSFTIFLARNSIQSYKVTKLQSYEVTTETSVKSIHVSCHIYYHSPACKADSGRFMQKNPG